MLLCWGGWFRKVCMLPVIGTGACATRGTTFVLSLADVVVRKQGPLWATGCTVITACLAGSFLDW
jgi:hypothetical protein